MLTSNKRSWTPNLKPAQSAPMSSVGDGDHAVKSVEVISKWEENGEPIFRLDKNQNLKLGIKFFKPDGSEGPAMALSAPELYALALLFDVDLSQLKPTYATRTSGKTVKSLIALINASSKVITVNSYNGWVNRINELRPPVLQYTFSFQGFARPDRQPGYQWYETKEKSKSLIATFVIEGDANGKKCLWSGYEISMWFNDGFGLTVSTEEGDVDAYKIGQPLLRYNYVTGQPTKAAKQWLAFNNMFISDQLENHEWSADNNGVDEIANPQIVMCTYAEEAIGKTFVGWIEIAGKNTIINLEAAFNAMNTSKYSWEDEEPFILEPFVTFMNETFGEGLLEVDGVNVSFTTKGKGWAKDYLSERGAWKDAGLDLDNRELGALTIEQIESLIEAIQKVNV